MTGGECRFANGPYIGRSLGDAWRAMPPEWRGTSVKRDGDFPLLVKFIFSEDKLSVQVHPDDAYASRHEHAAGGRGKTEMWYAMRARPGAEVLVGLRPNVTREDFQRAIAGGSAEECLTHVPIREGEAIFVPAGTIHTIGPGLLLCEIQQYSDITYRVYDYNRRDAMGAPRPLHVEKALEVIRFGEQVGGKVDPVRIDRGAVAETYFAACRYFATEKWEFGENICSATSYKSFDLLVFLEGHGNIHWKTENLEYGPAQVWMMPAALGDFQLSPSERTSLLRTCVPSDMKTFVRQLMDRGIDQASISRIVHT